MTKLEKVVLFVIYLALFTVAIELLNVIANVLGANIYVMISLIVLSSLTAIWILK